MTFYLQNYLNIMKKIFAIFIMTLGFGLTANAQQKKAAAPQPAQKEVSKETDEERFERLAAKDVKALGEVIGYTGTQERDFMGLFTYKYRNMAQNLSPERKANLSEVIEKKIMASLSAQQTERLAAKPELIKKLSN